MKILTIKQDMLESLRESEVDSRFYLFFEGQEIEVVRASLICAIRQVPTRLALRVVNNTYTLSPSRL